MLTPPGEPAPQAGEAASDDRADDIWNMALPGVQAALEALAWHWGEAYDIGVQDGQWWYRRKDGIGGRETAATPDALRIAIITDYSCLPVRKGQAQ